MLPIGPQSEALIIQEETGGQPLYNLRYVHPTWPGGASGVTIGCGYDCGYSTPSQIGADWAEYLDNRAVTALQSVAGIRGFPAKSHAGELHDAVSVPWELAIKVFIDRDIPKWMATLETSLPHLDLLPPECRGALLSVTFNRGASYSLPGSRYTEMRAIKSDMQAQHFGDIPVQLRSMKRLWPTVQGLRDRREHEAALFERSLAA